MFGQWLTKSGLWGSVSDSYIRQRLDAAPSSLRSHAQVHGQAAGAAGGKGLLLTAVSLFARR